MTSVDKESSTNEESLGTFLKLSKNTVIDSPLTFLDWRTRDFYIKGSELIWKKGTKEKGRLNLNNKIIFKRPLPDARGYYIYIHTTDRNSRSIYIKETEPQNETIDILFKKLEEKIKTSGGRKNRKSKKIRKLRKNRKSKKIRKTNRRRKFSIKLKYSKKSI